MKMKHQDGMGHMSHEPHHLYRNEVEKPSLPHEGHMMKGMGVHDYKAEADVIAYGQAGGPGCKSDDKKIHSQFKDYHWD